MVCDGSVCELERGAETEVQAWGLQQSVKRRSGSGSSSYKFR